MQVYTGMVVYRGPLNHQVAVGTPRLQRHNLPMRKQNYELRRQDSNILHILPVFLERTPGHMMALRSQSKFKTELKLNVVF